MILPGESRGCYSQKYDYLPIPKGILKAILKALPEMLNVGVAGPSHPDVSGKSSGGRWDLCQKGDQLLHLHAGLAGDVDGA